MDRLPSEILLAIAANLDASCDINALAQANRRFFNTLNNHLYRHDALEDNLEALSWAAQSGVVATAQMSITASRAIDDVSERLFAINHALYDAVANQHIDVISCILHVDGADPNIQNHFRPSTAMGIAAREGYTEIIKVLLSAKDTHPHPKDPLIPSPLSIAAYWGFVDIVKLLLEVTGIDVDSHDSKNRTPLFYAVLSDSPSPEIVSCFLNRSNFNVDVNVEDRSPAMHTRHAGRTPLIVASQFKSADMVNLLLTAPGIDVNHADQYGKTALHFAAELGTEDIVRALLHNHADPDPKDNENETPLFLAAKNGSVPVVKMLHEAGADPNHICDSGAHALGAARTEGYGEVARVLRNFDRLDLNCLSPVPRNWNSSRGKMWSERSKRNPDERP
jgi:ankyrin repeat protein